MFNVAITILQLTSSKSTSLQLNKAKEQTLNLFIKKNVEKLLPMNISNVISFLLVNDMAKSKKVI